MAEVTIPKIVERLEQLSTEKLTVVYDFVSYLAERRSIRDEEAFYTALASEDVLRRDWDLKEEDEAWADL